MNVMLLNLPKYVGFWRVTPGFKIAAPVKPRLWHRLWVRLLLGWDWIDA